MRVPTRAAALVPRHVLSAAAAGLALACGAPQSRGGEVEGTRHRPGDRIVYRYAGEALEAPVLLEERIASVDGLRLRIEVTARRGEAVRRWVQIVTDTEENRAANHVDALYEVDAEGTERLLANEDGEDLRELYDWTLPDVEWGEPGDEARARETRAFAGRSWTCTIARTALPALGADAAIELSDCEALVWTHGPGALVAGGRTLWSVEVVEVVEVGAPGAGDGLPSGP